MYWFKELEKYGKYFRRELIENEDYELINYNQEINEKKDITRFFSIDWKKIN